MHHADVYYEPSPIRLKRLRCKTSQTADRLSFQYYPERDMHIPIPLVC